MLRNCSKIIVKNREESSGIERKQRQSDETKQKNYFVAAAHCNEIVIHFIYLSREKNCETERSERIKEGPISHRGLFAHEHIASIHSTQASILIIYVSIVCIFIVGIVRRQNSHRIPQIPPTYHLSCSLFSLLHQLHTHLSFFSYLLDCMKVIFVDLFSRVSTVKGIFFDVAADVFVAISWYGTHERFDSVYKILQRNCCTANFNVAHRHTHITFIRTQKKSGEKDAPLSQPQMISLYIRFFS